MPTGCGSKELHPFLSPIAMPVNFLSIPDRGVVSTLLAEIDAWPPKG
jgi:hypothetical protein